MEHGNVSEKWFPGFVDMPPPAKCGRLSVKKRSASYGEHGSGSIEPGNARDQSGTRYS
jgi:hypothetical protein